MKMFNKFQSPLGYQVTDDLIDTYGVDHSNFSARDEVEYQFARQNKENQLIQNYNNQGLSDNYPQYGTNFWGNPDNNYGFGSSNIHDNIENRENQTEKSYGFGSNNQNQSVWNKNQYQTPTPWAKQSTGLGRNQPVPNKPVYENPNPQGYSAGNIAWSALEGFGEGIENGLLYATNAITHGGFDLLNDAYFNNAYEKKLNAFEDRLNQENIPAVNKAYKYAKYFIDNTAGNIPIVPFVKKAKQGYNTVKKLI